MEDLLQKERAEVCSFFGDELDERSLVSQSMNSGLFAVKKVMKVYGFLQKVADTEALINDLSSSTDTVVFIEESLDKRKKETKALLSNARIKVVEFEIPRDLELKKWVETQSKKYNLVFNTDALVLFLNRIGMGQEENNLPIYNLWQVDFELRKLKTFAGDKPVTKEDVENLISENLAEDIFKVTNAIGDKNRSLAIKYLTDYMDRIPGSDEKAKVITLSGLLSEQFRGILLVKTLDEERTPEKEMTVVTGYTPGRLFIYKKLARSFTKEKILETLKKMEFLDEELKTTSGPAALQFFMIIESGMR